MRKINWRIKYDLFIKSLLKLVSCEYYVISIIQVFSDFYLYKKVLLSQFNLSLQSKKQPVYQDNELPQTLRVNVMHIPKLNMSGAIVLGN